MADTPWEDFATVTPAASEEEGPWAEFAGSAPIIAGLSAPTKESLESENRAQLVKDLKAGVRKQVNNAVGVVDMALGIPGQLLGIGTDIGGRINALAHGGTRQQAEQVGKMNRESPAIQAMSNPVASFMKGLGWQDDFDKSDVSQVMGGLMKAVESGGEWVNEKTGGVLTKEDTVSLFNTAMGSLGARGLATLDPAIKALGDPKLGKPKSEPFLDDGPGLPKGTEFAAKVEKNSARAAEAAKTEARVREKEGTGTSEEAAAAWEDWSKAFSEEPLAVRDRKMNAENKAYNLMRSGADKATVDRMVKKDKYLKEALDRITARREMVKDSRLGTVIQGEVLDAGGPLVVPGVDPVVPPAPNKRGPSALLPAAIVATGLGLAYQFGGDEDLAAAAIGGGVVLAGRGRGVKLEALNALPDMTPLGTIRDQLGYTFSTLERLPGGRPTINRSLILEQLKRQDVTAAERGVFEAALKLVPEGESVSAKQLVGALKVVADDWELRKQTSNEYADYGLESIDRKTADEYDGIGPEVLTRAEPNTRGDLWIVDDGYGDVTLTIPREQAATPEQALAAARQRILDGRQAEASATTHIYQLPSIELGTNNHFGDPNYFGHTRVFEEGGVRHVVEVQSDLAQKAGKVLTEGERADLQTQSVLADRLSRAAQKAYTQLSSVRSTASELAQAVRDYISAVPEEVQLDYKLGLGVRMLRYAESFVERSNPDPNFVAIYKEMHALAKAGLDDKIVDYGLGVLDEASKLGGKLGEAGRNLRDKSGEIQSLFEDTFSRESTRMSVWRSETQAKLADSASIAPVSPLLKSWYKRLVREELADAARPKVNRVYGELADEITQMKFDLEAAKERGMEDLAEGYVESLKRMEAELANTPRELPPEQVVRFATADTVAKVEGWPNYHETARRDLARARQDLAAAEVGRVGNAGLRPDVVAERARLVIRGIEEELPQTLQEPAFRPEHQSIYDRYRTDIEKFLRQLGGKPYTDSAGHTWIEVPVEGSKALPAGPRTQMFGGIEPEVAAAMAAVGASMWLVHALSDDNKLRNALSTGLGVAVLGLTVLSKSKSRGVADVAQSALDTGNNFAASLMYQLKQYSPPIARAHRNFERLLLTSTHNRLQRVAAWTEGLRTVPAEYQNALAGAVLTGSTEAIDKILYAAGKINLRPALLEVNKVLTEVGKELVEMKLLKNLVKDYYPRIVADYPGLMEYLGVEAKQFVEKRLHDAEQRAKSKGAEGLNELERSAILNQALQDSIFSRGGEGRRFLKGRTIKEVTEGIAPFYESPADSLPIYIRAATNAIEKARYFGKGLILDPATGKINNVASIGNVVNEQIQAGKLSIENRAKIEKLLEARFGPGEEVANRAVRALQNFTTATLVANLLTALMNLTDIGTIAAMQGILPTIKGVTASLLRRDGRIRNIDLGLADQIAEEFVGASRKPVTVMGRQLSVARFLDKTMRMSGFKALDMVMKETSLNAAEISARSKLKTKGGEAEFIRDNGEYFGDDISALISDLRAGERSNLVYEYAFGELSDHQALTKADVPAAYLRNPEMRFMWQVKTFMIKQLDLLRERGINKIAKGDPRSVMEGTSFLLRYALLVGSAGASMTFIINSILGRDTNLDWGDIPLTALRNFSLSQYIIDKAKEGKLKEAFVGMTSPALLSLFDIVSADPKSVSRIPIFGRLVYDRLLGGAEKANEKAWRKEEAQKRKDEREADMTEEDREEAETRKAERDEARLERYRNRGQENDDE